MNLNQKESIEKHLGFNNPIDLITPLSGGDINDVYAIGWKGLSDFVVKINCKLKFPKMFEKEAFALKKLAGT